ncbi:MAG: molybdenum cofactor cytidylyltransferase [Candidatus Azotimanducaceae bacterium]|jgi:molybdenum cofactor cytidylyltransferase
MIGAMVLAAGSSRRFGADKRRATLPNGQLVVEQTTSKALEAFDQVLLVLRNEDEPFASELVERLNHPNLQTFCAPDSALGMGHSLAGAAALIDGWQAAFILLADMPFITTETLNHLREEMLRAANDQTILIPEYQGERGQPVGFAKKYFEALRALSGDTGARHLIKQYGANVSAIPVSDRGILQDIDTPADLSAL